MSDDVLGTRRTPNKGMLWALLLATFAAGLRVWHLGHGLPEFSEEAIIFRKALELWGPDGQGGDLNPHLFVYPSLTIYLHYFLQRGLCLLGGVSRPADYLLGILIDPTMPVLFARGLGVAADVITVLLVGRIARRFGGLPAIISMVIVACAPFSIRTARLIYNDPVMCALSLMAIDRILSYLERGGQARLMLAGAAIGLATGAKYPAVVLIIPLGLAAWRQQRGWELARALAIAGASAAVAFLITTPYVLASWPEFVRDAFLHRDVAGKGSLGKLTGTGLPYYLVGLGRNLGWLGLSILAVSLIRIWRSPRSPALMLLWACWLVFFLPIALARVEAERYMLPIIAISAILAGSGVAFLLACVPLPLKRPAAFLGLALLLAPVLWGGVRAASSGRSSTELEARRWIEGNISAGDLILSEAYGPTVLSLGKMAEVYSSDLLAAASPDVQQRYMAQPAFHHVWLPLIVGGHLGVGLGVDGAEDASVYPHVVDWNAAVYDIRLLAGVDYVVTTSAVRERFEQDSIRFGEQKRFYSFLDRVAERVAEFRSTSSVEGPGITVYRISPPARDTIASAGRLDLLWWARTVPEDFRTRAWRTATSSLTQPDSAQGIPLWARALRAAYAERYAGFSNALAENLVDLGRLGWAVPLCEATLQLLPEDVRALYLYAQAAGGLGRWMDVKLQIDRSMSALARQGGTPDDVILLKARVLLAAGLRAEAVPLLRGLLGSHDATIAVVARGTLREMTQRSQ